MSKAVDELRKVVTVLSENRHNTAPKAAEAIIRAAAAVCDEMIDESRKAHDPLIVAAALKVVKVEILSALNPSEGGGEQG